MFDGLGASAPPPAPDPGPIPCDARATLPLLRMQGLQATIGALSIMAGNNTLTMVRLKALGEPAGYGLDDATPAGRAIQATTLLAEVCARYRNVTGNDGLSLAHDTITRIYGEPLARTIIAPLRERQWSHAIDVLLHDPEEIPAPTITPEEHQEACWALAEYALSAPGFEGVSEALDGYLNSLGVPALAETTLAHLHMTLARSAAAGVTKEEMQFALDAWSQGTGGPTFIVGDAGE